jgi:hypothetical protein
VTYQEAKRILHPDTTTAALAEIAYYAEFHGEEAKLEAVNEACVVACEALDTVISAQSTTEDIRNGIVWREYSEENRPKETDDINQLYLVKSCYGDLSRRNSSYDIAQYNHQRQVFEYTDNDDYTYEIRHVTHWQYIE